MPVWHDLTRKARQSEQLVLLGVIQEQHPDRCQLYSQWQGFDWTILHDPINQLQSRAVPMFVAIDEAGVVVDANLKTSELAAFLARPPAQQTDRSPSQESPNYATRLRQLDDMAQKQPTAAAWRELADHRVLWGPEQELTSAIEEYQRALELAPQDAATHFGLGVAYRMRLDSSAPREADFQRAVDAWGRALEIDPNHYIFRRRIQQYGPRLIKPYPFYDWVAQAQQEIEARGEVPVALTVQPSGAEIAQPSRNVTQDQKSVDEPDPRDRITLDRNLVHASIVVVPGVVQKGDAVRVHIELRPHRLAHWNNEADPLGLWIRVPEGWKSERTWIEAPSPETAESRETRHFEFELQSPEDTAVQHIEAYALYYICEEIGGQCLYRRTNLKIPIRFSN